MQFTLLLAWSLILIFSFISALEQEKLLRQVKALLDNTTASSDATELTNGTSVVVVYRVQSTSIKSKSNLSIDLDLSQTTT